ncbi:hypothetical protein HY522_09295 [bacterium]|nr:hypothetical protein [bacterium]
MGLAYNACDAPGGFGVKNLCAAIAAALIGAGPSWGTLNSDVETVFNSRIGHDCEYPVLGNEELGILNVALTGTWWASRCVAGTGAGIFDPCVIEHFPVLIGPGVNDFVDFPGCSILGVQSGTPFMVWCSQKALKGDGVYLHLRLVNPLTGKVEPLLSPREALWGYQNQVEVHVFRMTTSGFEAITAADGVHINPGGGPGTPAWAADLMTKSEVVPDFFEEVSTPGMLRFDQAGKYKVTFIWKMLGLGGPYLGVPKSQRPYVEVSRASAIIEVVDEWEKETVSPKGTGGEYKLEDLEFQVGVDQVMGLTKVAFLVERLAGSGGHEAAHHHGPKTVAAGTWEVMEGAVEDTPVTHPTGGVDEIIKPRSAVVKNTYTASSFGGRERIKLYGVPADFDTPQINTQKDLRDRINARRLEVCPLGAVEIEVKVPDLVQQPDGIFYFKVGGTPEHHGPPGFSEDNNHYGTQKLTFLVDDIASNYVGSALGLIRVNDMSLGKDGKGYGGKFDVAEIDPTTGAVTIPGGSWGKNPHHTNYFGHANGHAADIGFLVQTSASGTVQDERTAVRQALRASGLRRTWPDRSVGVVPDRYFREGNHYHVMK